MGTSTHHYSYLAYNHFIREYLREYFGDERKYWKNKPVYNMTAQSSFNSATFHTDNTADRYSVYTTETHSARWDDTLIWFAFGVVKDGQFSDGVGDARFKHWHPAADSCLGHHFIVWKNLAKRITHHFYKQNKTTSAYQSCLNLIEEKVALFLSTSRSLSKAHRYPYDNEKS